ncbi:hypothetical protein, partial [Pseudomonas fluorescens]
WKACGKWTRSYAVNLSLSVHPFHRRQTTKPRCRLSKNKPATTRYAARITWPAFISRAVTPTAPMPTSRFLRVSQPSKSIVKTKT